MAAAAELSGLAREAFIYGFPLVFNLRQVQRYVSTGVGANPAAAFNTFSHARTLAGPDDKFVTINNDTVYSFAQIDLSAGPLLLELPDTAGRYYVMQFISAWTENFAYVGKRSTGTAAGRFLLVPPGWVGNAPPDTRVIEFPTRVGTINGRWAVNGAEDLPAVHALQDGVRLAPAETPGNRVLGLLPVPAVSDPSLAFWEAFRIWSRSFAPPQRDAVVQAGFGALGLTGDGEVAEAAPEIRAALARGFETGNEFVATSLRGGHVPEVNGWQLALHAFDYNIDHFQLGTIHSPQWRIEDPRARLIMRAGAALGGLWGNHGYEAAYITTYVDDRGEQLTGAHTYELTLNPPPPNAAFWSLTMYDVPNYFLVANPLNRYSVGDRTPDLVWGPSGSITITISHRRPTEQAAANWLPAPPGDFRPMLRVYVPGEDVLDGTYEIPPIRRVDQARVHG